jgi:Kef-type K+ transport system membrane component KefB
MGEPADPEVPPPPWEPLLAGFRRHGPIGKLFVVVHSVLALLFVAAEVLGSGGSTRAILVFLIAAGIEFALAVGVTLHRRAFIIVAFALSVFGLVCGLYALTLAWRHTLILIACLAALALNVMFVRYFGRLQRRSLEAALTPGNGGPSPNQGAA